MRYRQLGSSGLRVSVLTMGTMTFGGSGWFADVGSTDADTARQQIDQCLEAGVNLIDTANVYSRGVSEEMVGAALEGRRDAALLATKVRMPMGRGPNDAGLSRHAIVTQCEASLRRLRTDYIDLYQVHEWDGQTPLEETLEALDLLLTSGKVRYVGCSNYAGWQLMKALGIADRRQLPRFVSQQIYYSLQARRRVRAHPRIRRPGPGRAGLEPARRRADVGQVPAGRAGAGGIAPPHRLGRAACA
jgi:aryl-alcohol dehydrogenase-like predicted oxidoreductase